MVGYRNPLNPEASVRLEFIRRSDGGVSELNRAVEIALQGVYQAFRWWGIGTVQPMRPYGVMSLSGVPMVGYRNQRHVGVAERLEFIRRSDGGVSEP